MGIYKQSSCECIKLRSKSHTIYKMPSNPNPNSFKIERVYENQNGWLVAQVIYPDAKNYEGRKILLYKITSDKLYAAKFLDPHFCDDKTHISPFARFEPTDNGWDTAVSLCKSFK